MNKKIILLVLAIGLIIGIILVLFRIQQKSSLDNPLADKSASFTKITPSETFIEYTDPSGFSFSYPDNLSLVKNDTDANTYADLLLSANGVNGSLTLKISDSKLASIDEWVKINKTASSEVSKEVKLGNLKALEVRLNDRVLLGALDQGVLFTIEMPRIEEEFWMKVYNIILADFSFTSPSQDSSTNASSSDDVIFEGEEVIE